MNDGTGNFTVFDAVTTGGNPWMIAIGDVNGDGFVDVAVANSTSHNIAIVMTDGSGGLQFDRYYAVGDFPVAIDLGDIDGDGDLDFISSNFNGPNYILMENDGSGTFVNPRIYPSPFHAACATIHDRNNDGAMDISMIDEGEDLVLLYNNTLSLGDDGPVADMGLTLYPNPIKNILYIKANDYINSVLISNVLGQVLYNSNVDALEASIDMSGYAKGTYFVKISVAKNTIIKKIIKE